MKQVYIVFYLILCSVFVPECLARTPDEIFGNMTYMIGDEYRSQKVTLVNGKYRYPDRHPLLCVYYEEGNFVYGDFNSDGLKDAAVIITDSGGGSGYSINLAFLINDGTKLVHKSSYDLGYRPDIISLAEQRGKVVIDMLVYNESTWAEGIMDRVRNIYEYAGPQVWGEERILWREGRNMVGEDNRASLNSYADSSKGAIADLYKSGIVDGVKRNIRYFSISPENYAQLASCAISLLGFQEILEYKFLMIAQFPESEGVEHVYIAIDSKPMRYFKLWMHPTSEGTYQMRRLKEVSIKAEEEFFVHLKSDLSESWQGF